MRPHSIQVSSSRWDRLDEAEELDTSEEPLFLREPFTDLRDLQSVSSNLPRHTHTHTHRDTHRHTPTDTHPQTHTHTQQERKTDTHEHRHRHSK